MAMACTRDERLVLRYLAWAEALRPSLPPQLAAPAGAVKLHAPAHHMGSGRKAKYHPRPTPLGQGREVSLGLAIGDYIARRWGRHAGAGSGSWLAVDIPPHPTRTARRMRSFSQRPRLEVHAGV